MSDYWSNFNSWDNNVEILPEAEHSFRAEHTFVSEGNSKYITHGKSVYSTHGASWTYQDGDVTWYQIGNLGYKQIGVSNTVIEGWNFFTVLGMSMNTTVGMGIDSYFGLRVGINFLGTVDVNVAAGVRLGKGGYYDFEDTTHWKTAAQKVESTGEELKIADSVKLVIGEQISINTVESLDVGNKFVKRCVKSETECSTLYSMTAPVMTLSATDLTLKAGVGLVGPAFVGGEMALLAGSVKIEGKETVIIYAAGLLKLG